MIKERLDECNLIIYEPKCSKEKNIIVNNYHKICNKIEKLWEIKKPDFPVEIYILESYTKFALKTYPFLSKILLILLFPYWHFVIKKDYEKGRGSICFDNNKIIIKLNPMEKCIKNKEYDKIDILSLIEKEKDISNYIFKSKKNSKIVFLATLIIMITDSYLYSINNLSTWLILGLRTITEEIILNEETVNYETLKLFTIKPYEKIEKSDSRYINSKYAYNYVKGYWTVRYLEEKYPGFLKEVLNNYEGEEIENQIIKILNLNKEKYWEQLDDLLYENYKYLLNE